MEHNATLKEIKDRVTRLESRLVQLGDHVGANLRIRLQVNVRTDQFGEPWVEVDALDISFARIVCSLREHGYFRGEIPIVFDGQRIGMAYPARAPR